MSDKECIHFVLPPRLAVNLGYAETLDVDRDWTVFVDGVLNWIFQTYCILRQRRNVAVSIGAALRSNSVNVAHASHLANCWPQHEMFVVCVRADYQVVPWACLHIVQNQTQTDASHFWIPHWQQPGLIPRRRDRNSVERVGFAGQSYYLAGKRDDWQRELGRIGCELEMLSPDCWNDLSDIDVLLAIRSFDGQSWDNKPPTKLINAWLAGIPLVGGPDSAFEQIGSPGIDYLRVQSMDEAARWIRILRASPELYRSIVKAGRIRGVEFVRESVALRWEALFEERILPEFRKWRQARSARVVSVRSVLSWGRGAGAFLRRQLYSRIPASMRRALNPNFPK